jgi:signal transduction histidine kinase/DNA-binding response OmpR family regulator
MFMNTACLSDFIEPAPICFQTDTLAEVLEVFSRGGCDRLVVINEQRCPIGLIQLRSLMPRNPETTTLLIDFQRPLSAVGAPLLEPLPALPGDLSLSQCEGEFRDQTERFWALVDGDRHFQGLIDSFYVRKLIQLGGGVSSTAVIEETLIESMAGSVQAPLEFDSLKQHLRVQIAKLRSQLQPKPFLETSASHPLMQFLERLPLPLMLQTSTGKVLAQNALWHEQFGEIVDPGWVQRDADAVLEFAAQSHLSDSDATRIDSWERSIGTSSESALASLCHIGSTPNTCICACPLKNGQERILQLVKIPLGAMLPEMELGLADLWEMPVVNDQWSLGDFRLAKLDSDHPTPPRRWVEEESLWLVLTQDVTEQQQLARELAAKNADLVQLNRLKDEFLACISHELRTPLTAVLGLSSLLKDQLSGGLSERQIRYAQLIYRSGRHLMAIVNDILDLTRMETGQLELSLEPVNVSTVCDRAFEQAQKVRSEEAKPEAGQEANLAAPSFTLEIESGLETLVADEMRLRQMLVNLLSNALKFTESTGRIGLRVNLWEGWVTFTVWDTGIGIAAEKQHLIFQKFQQLENPLTRRFEGAGLGLVLTQRLARLHGGDVSFVSKEGQGSQFTLLLPPTHPQPTIALGTSPIQACRTPSHNRLVLVVESVVRSIEHLSEQLFELGYRVVIARSGTEAVEKARRLQPCSIFVNPLLPTLSGWDVLTLLKADPQTHHIPVIVTATRGDREQATRNQADGFLSLPIASKALKQTLAHLTEAAEPSEASEKPVESLVILRLSPTRYGEQSRVGQQATIDLNHLLHRHNYRVLEADDLEQAELLAQVWKPNIVLLDAAMPDPIAYIRRLSEQSFLASLPIVTLDQATTQAANQIVGLSIFPCLAPLVEQSVSSGQSETSALLQVIQVAAGFAWRPSVLAIDLAHLNHESARESEWLQAMMQYIQTAGFRGIVGRSWAEVLQKLQSQSVDLLLICWHDTQIHSATLQAVSSLKSLKSKPPILVLDHRAQKPGTIVSPEVKTFSDLLTELAAPILPHSLQMEELLSQINRILT